MNSDPSSSKVPVSRLFNVFIDLNSENRKCRLAKQKSNKANLLNLYPLAKGYFRETDINYNT